MASWQAGKVQLRYGLSSPLPSAPCAPCAPFFSVPSQELIQQRQVPSHLVLVPGEICVGPMRLAMKPQLCGKLMKHEGFYLMKQYETSTWDFG